MPASIRFSTQRLYYTCQTQRDYHVLSVEDNRPG